MEIKDDEIFLELQPRIFGVVSQFWFSREDNYENLGELIDDLGKEIEAFVQEKIEKRRKKDG